MVYKTLESEGFESIEVDLSCEPRKVTVKLENEASLAQFRTILRKLGYPFSDDKVGLVDNTALKAKSFVSYAVGKFSAEN